MTTKTASIMMTILVAVIMVVNFIHAKLILPAVLLETRVQTREMISNHGRNPHIGVVTRQELQLIIQEMRSFETDTKAALARIEEKIDRR